MFLVLGIGRSRMFRCGAPFAFEWSSQVGRVVGYREQRLFTRLSRILFFDVSGLF